MRKVVFAEGRPDRRLYEVATFATLRDRLRAGDVWVVGARSYRPLDAHLMPPPAFSDRVEADDLGLGVPRNVDSWLAEKQRELDFKLKQFAYRARSGKVPGVRMADGVLIVSPQRSNVPKAAEAVKWQCLDRMPLIEITDLIAEFDAWTGFSSCFTHLRTGEPVRSLPALYAAILADATNLGPKRMADASDGVSARQIAWARLFHLRHETFKTSVARIIDAQLAHPYAQIWGTGTTSSSDGQFFRAAAQAQREATSTPTMAVIRVASSTPGSPISTDTSTSCRSVRPKAKQPMFSMGSTVMRAGSSLMSTMSTPVALTTTSSLCFPCSASGSHRACGT
ncbi:Tn3 family transposase [Ensifer sp. IC4062]|nr:Tn3 family transposase [Ensifer sp. IC4062]